MGGATTTKRGDTRGQSKPPTHLKHEVIGVLLITLSLLTLLSLVSYVPGDASLFGPSNGGASASARNMIGSVGATLASFLFGLVGGGAYLLSVLLAMLGARCFVEGELAVTLRSAAGSFAALMFLSGLLHLEVTAVPTLSSGFVYRGQAGGRVGQAIAEGLRGYFASTGAHIIVLAGLVISLLLATPMSLADLARRLSQWWISCSELVMLRVPAWWERSKETLSALLPERAAGEAARAKKIRPRPLKINRPEPVAATAVAPPVEDKPAVAAPVPAPVPEPVAVVSEPEQSPSVEPVVKEPRRKSRKAEVATARAAAEGYRLPDPLELLSDPSGPIDRLTDEQLKAQSEVLTKALLNFAVEGKVTEVHPGPVVTMYEFEPAPGVKVARIVNLADDLALAMKAISLRIVAPLPGKSVVGVEVPNPSRETVALKEVVTSEAFTRSRSKLRLALGKDIFGKPVAADLKTMPHLLVAGATGAGKSVGLNTMLLSLLFTAKPDEVKLLLVDPKMLEFKAYDGLPHLLRPVITDAKSAARGLGWVVQEMERRYKLLAEAGVRNVDDYNRRVAHEQGTLSKGTLETKATQADLPIEFLSEDARLAAGESTVAEGPRQIAEPKTPPSPLPYIVVMIDELADLMAVAPKEVEEKIARLAQMARASGIHLVLATQRPSVDVLTGLIKANFPARIAFQVSSKTDSRTILDANGAEALLGRGDMLYLASGTGKIVRLHGSFVPDDDVHRVVEFVKKQA